MPNLDSIKLGNFCWLELGTSDQKAAKTFYGALFGWAAEDMPMGPTESYTTFKLDARSAGACYTLRPGQTAVGVPPHWMLYVAVESADDAVKKVVEAGGTAMMPAFDVMELGRMSVLQDPAGAMFSVWQAKLHSGIEVAGEPGTLCWADLNVPDPQKEGKFYSDMFGWKLEPGKDAGYLHIKNGDEYIGGAPTHLEGHMPPHWMAYILVDDCDASVEKVKQLGGKLHMGPHDIPDTGRFAILADPQGAVFATFQPKHATA